MRRPSVFFVDPADLNRIAVYAPDRRGDDLPLVLVGLSIPWSAEVVQYTPDRPCPICGDGPIRPNRVCLVCHRTRRDGTRWPMQVDAGPPPLREHVKAARKAAPKPSAWRDLGRLYSVTTA